MPTVQFKSLPFQPRQRSFARTASLAAIGLAHVLLLWGLAWSMRGRDSALEAGLQPLFVQIVEPLGRPAPPDIPLSVPGNPAPRVAAPLPPLLPLPAVDASTPEPVTLAPAAPAPVQPAARVAAPAAAEPASAPAAAAAPVERQIAVTQVEYLTPPLLVYPLAARRLREQGRAQVWVRVDEQGRPDRVLLLRSSGSERLDEAALASVRATRFKPYTEDGQPRPFWVVMPLIFELDT